MPSGLTPGSLINSRAVDSSSQSPTAPVISLAHRPSSPARKVRSSNPAGTSGSGRSSSDSRRILSWRLIATAEDAEQDQEEVDEVKVEAECQLADGEVEDQGSETDHDAH